MKTMTKLFAAFIITISVTSCGTTTQAPRAIPVNESPFGDIINGLRDGRQMIREGGDFVREMRRFREL